MLDDLYVMEKDNCLFIGVNYIVGGREAESEYILEGENVKKFKELVGLDGFDVVTSCEKRFGNTLDQPKLREFFENNSIEYTSKFWVC